MNAFYRVASPLRVGDRAVITSVVGLSARASTLRLGVVGTVWEIRYQSGARTYGWVADDEHVTDSDGVRHPVRRQWMYTMTDRHLSAVEAEDVRPC